ncbi:SGNH/GDSL hydrolase family protein [Cellulomonas cellasea]|uniref:Lysophospholipase L1-like esterase n=1 Tax=Cellulomonas cellasea TaxID=43670 RepID=A0A7W4UHN8_9CELL|nr:SGNH/GDSL hydrolase family protein [Cellulomonas cellasea]MBB2924328.1 lysophospholipase L1-like esterase [Cellulomonas cellasea]
MKRSWTCLTLITALLAGPGAATALAGPANAASAATAVGAAPADLAPGHAPAPGLLDVTDAPDVADVPDLAGEGAPDGGRHHPRPGRPLHVAIGDSVPAGQQSVPPAVDFPTTAALWKANGFVARFHAVLPRRLDCTPGRGRHGADPDHRGRGCRGIELVNLSRTGIPGVAGGVTTGTVLGAGDQLDQAVALLDARNHDRSRRNDVEVVTVSVGGNDVYGPAVAACVLVSTPACVPTLETTFAGFVTRYDEVLRTLREHAGPTTLILGMTYYNPLPFCDLGATDPARVRLLGDAILEGGELGSAVLPAGFNDRIREVAARYDVTVVETFGLLGTGDFVGGTDCVHPDGEGHERLARAFAAALPH